MRVPRGTGSQRRRPVVAESTALAAGPRGGVWFPHPASGRPGLAVFLNAGDPSLRALAELTTMLDEQRVDVLELAVPFPDSPTDGPVIRRSADRALANGVDLDATLSFVAEVRPRLRHLKIVLLADWSYTVRGISLPDFAATVRASGADAALLHGVPPRLRAAYYTGAAEAGLPVVTTCYHQTSTPETLREATREATAFVYLVARYGRSGVGRPDAPTPVLAPTIAALRAAGPHPVAVGFGVRSADDLRRIHREGADAAVVGSAGVARIEASLTTGADVVADLARFICDLHPPACSDSSPTPKGPS